MWKTAVRCEASDCVEIAFFADCVAVRDSKHRMGAQLRFTYAEWNTFVEGVAAGDFACPA
jgi:hypothetical protein